MENRFEFVPKKNVVQIVVDYYLNFIMILGTLGIIGLAIIYTNYWANTTDIWLQLFQLIGWGLSVIFGVTELIKWIPNKEGVFRK